MLLKYLVLKYILSKEIKSAYSIKEYLTKTCVENKDRVFYKLNKLQIFYLLT